ncbi:MAG: hypothetical protein IJH32_03780, partial [Ruminococcus sp.]|nr:hypothetical protein [Ruminococcus sp.]
MMNKEENELTTGAVTDEEIQDLEEEYTEPVKAESENNAYVFPTQTYKEKQKSIQKRSKQSRSVKEVDSEDDFVIPKESYKSSIKNSRKREKAARARAKEAQRAGADEDEDEYIASHKRHHHH